MRKLLLAALLFTVPAMAHEAPTGWQYGVECCSVNDCWREPRDAIQITSKGYLVVVTGEVIPYGDYRLKKSQDSEFHRCSIGGDKLRAGSLCLYVPPMGM